jgi:hypothetical protein
MEAAAQAVPQALGLAVQARHRADFRQAVSEGGAARLHLCWLTVWAAAERLQLVEQEQPVLSGE